MAAPPRKELNHSHGGGEQAVKRLRTDSAGGSCASASHDGHALHAGR